MSQNQTTVNIEQLSTDLDLIGLVIPRVHKSNTWTHPEGVVNKILSPDEGPLSDWEQWSVHALVGESGGGFLYYLDQLVAMKLVSQSDIEAVFAKYFPKEVSS